MLEVFDPNHVFVTSDCHFGSWREPRPTVVFTEDEESRIIDAWNSIVQPSDLVICNGDFYDGKTAIGFMEYASKLNGKMALILGNHDTLPLELYKAAFDFVGDELVLDLHKVIFHHIPDESRVPLGFLEIFGHLHRGWLKPMPDHKSFCSCIQYSKDFKPYRLSEILDNKL